MNDFYYANPAHLYFGRSAVEELPALIGEHKVMLVYGGKSAKVNGAYDTITRVLRENHILWVDFGGNTEPSYQKALEGIELCKDEKIGCIIGVGGCTCMDLAKIIAFGAKNENLWGYLSFEIPVTGKEDHLLIGAIPTYPSGGSEADEAAEIDDLERGVHGSLYGIHADFSILNPEFTYSLSKEQTAYAAMVTFAQASICYLGGYSPIAEGFTRTVLDAIRSSVQAALFDPKNYEARATQMWASALTTLGILSCGKDKSWAWSFYSDLEIIRQCMPISYRQAMTVLFPRWLEAQAVHHGDDVRRYMVSVMGVNGGLPVQSAVQEGVQRLIGLFESVGLPMTYRAFGKTPTQDELESASAAAEQDSALSKEELTGMYLACMLEQTTGDS